ncbi:MAG: hypothetical protein ABSG91_01995 [Syntrophobacteraceae bacterium]|jgi:hypothetical protein
MGLKSPFGSFRASSFSKKGVPSDDKTPNKIKHKVPGCRSNQAGLSALFPFPDREAIGYDGRYSASCAVARVKTGVRKSLKTLWIPKLGKVKRDGGTGNPD